MCLLLSVVLGLISAAPVYAAEAETAAKARTLFTNVHVFDGVNQKRIENANVLVEGNLIKQVSTKPIKADGATVIDGGGRTLMPGLIDAHVHVFTGGATVMDVLTAPHPYLTVKATVQAQVMLMNGVTTVRDMAGPTFGLKRGIDEGRIPGPRIYPSGAMISQTSGHLDFRPLNQANPSFGGPVPSFQRDGYGVIVDGVPKMLAAVREQLRLGATQIKLAIGGGVASPTDPIDVTEFTKEEIAAAVAAAENWGTYVTVHGYTVRSINQAIDAGVKGIEHGQLLDQKTIRRMAKEGIWLSFQPFTECVEPGLSPAQLKKQAIVCKGTAKVYELIKATPKLKVVHSTDIFIDPGDGNMGQVKQMERLLKWFTP
ncbi:MAG: amidohydrolase family protein, partial [Myxococcales bacterium]|nr:amidohydrolase family protein [Myxococcales bacterium]